MNSLKQWLLPPAGNLLLALATLPFCHRFEVSSPFFLLVSVNLVVLYALCTPKLGYFLLTRLRIHKPVDVRQLPAGAALVVLDAGCHPGAAEWSGGCSPKAQTLERLRYAAYLQKHSKLPLLASGDGAGAQMAELVREEFGAEVAWVEDRSRDTAENAALSAAILQAEGFRRIVLISHFWHLPRAVAAFERTGLEVIPAPMGFFALGRHERGGAAFLPSPAGLASSYWACHEWLGAWYYRLRSLPNTPKG